MTRYLLDHRRKSLRLSGYDYSQPGAYFVTICTFRNQNLLGEIHNREMFLNDAGRIVEKTWLEIPEHFLIAGLDSFVVMPNHIHGILVLVEMGSRGTACRAPTERFGKPVPDSLPTIIRSFKSAATRRFNIFRNTTGLTLWQRNYYEHIIRSEESLFRIRKYIVENPLCWEEDPENSNRGN